MLSILYVLDGPDSDHFVGKLLERIDTAIFTILGDYPSRVLALWLFSDHACRSHTFQCSVSKNLF